MTEPPEYDDEVTPRAEPSRAMRWVVIAAIAVLVLLALVVHGYAGSMQGGAGEPQPPRTLVLQRTGVASHQG